MDRYAKKESLEGDFQIGSRACGFLSQPVCKGVLSLINVVHVVVLCFMQNNIIYSH